MKNDMCMYLLYSNVYSNGCMTYYLMYEAWLSSSAHFNESQCIFTGQFYLTHAGTQRGKLKYFFLTSWFSYFTAAAASNCKNNFMITRIKNQNC